MCKPASTTETASRGRRTLSSSILRALILSQHTVSEIVRRRVWSLGEEEDLETAHTYAEVLAHFFADGILYKFSKENLKFCKKVAMHGWRTYYGKKDGLLRK